MPPRIITCGWRPSNVKCNQRPAARFGENGRGSGSPSRETASPLMLWHMQETRTSRIAIVGAGSVGATIAYACMVRGIGKQIALYDVNRGKVEAEVLDLNHGMQFVPMASIEGSDDVAVCADADVVVITAGAKQKPGQSRMALAESNVGICKTLVPQLVRLSPGAILLLVTNPVDVLTYVVTKISGFPPRRVLGSGTVL